MSDLQTPVAGATLKLSPDTIQAIKDAWRAAGGVDYSSPKGQICAMSEPKLLAFLSEALLAADRTATSRPGPTSDLAQHCDRVEHALFQLVKAVCPGLDHNDLLGDAAIARAAMASGEPIAFFQCETGDDGVARYQNVQAEFQTDPDIFPLYRRAPTVAELQAYVGDHYVATDSKVESDVRQTPSTPAETKATGAAKKAGAK